MLYATCEYSSRAPEPVAPPRLPKQHVLPDGTPDYVKLINNSKVYDIVQETPLTPCLQLGERLGNEIWLKREDLQPVFSFKIRGAYNRIAFLDEDERKKGVATASAGNHAQGVALSANRLGIPCTIVMPLGTPRIKVDSVRRLGGENLEIVLHGVDFDEAKEECLRLVEAQGLTFIPPFDDPLVIAGQGTIGVEILNQTGGNLDGIFTPIGGGGMAAGVSVYVKQTADPKVKVLGVETYDADGMAQSLEKGERVLLSEVGLFSDGTAVRLVGEECFRLCKQFLDRPVVKVGTDEICAAIKDIFEETRSIAEPAGALALAGLKKYISQNNLIGANKRFVAVVSGANMNFDRLRFVAQRAELGEGREALLSVEIPERTGSFFALHEAILPHAITEFVYRFDKPDVAQVFVSINLTTADREKEVSEVLAQLESKAMKGVDISNDELAKTHVRYMVGGRASVPDERVFSFEFPERPGALREFLRGISSDWNISLFHYRNYGSDVGKILGGIQVPANTDEKFKEFLQSLRYPYVEETDNVVYRTYLRK